MCVSSTEERRTSANPEHALRYNRDPSSVPLWAGLKGQPPPGAPPPCARCGAARTFEFQLMPQLLCAIEDALPPRDAAAALSDEADLDFGVVAVYTCSASCTVAADGDPATSAYASEWCWHQPLQ